MGDAPPDQSGGSLKMTFKTKASSEPADNEETEQPANVTPADTTDTTKVEAAEQQDGPDTSKEAAPAAAAEAPTAQPAAEAPAEDDSADAGGQAEVSDGVDEASSATQGGVEESKTTSDTSPDRKKRIVDSDSESEDGAAAALGDAVANDNDDDDDDDGGLAMDEDPAPDSDDDNDEDQGAAAGTTSGDDADHAEESQDNKKDKATEKTSAKLQALFGDGSDDSDSDEGGFEGFDAAEFEPAPKETPTKKKGKKAAGEKKPKKRKERSEAEDSAPAAPMSHYDEVMLKRKQKNQRKRRKKDSDGVGDAAVEDAVRKVIDIMVEAHKKDEEAFKRNRPATHKLKALKTVVQALNNVKLQEEFIEKDVFDPIAKWLSPHPESGVLPNVTIRNALIKILHDSFTKVTIDDIRPSGIGKVLMMLKETKGETRENKARLDVIVRAWSSQIWGVVSDQSAVPMHDRQEHYHKLASYSARRRSSNSELEETEEVRRPGKEGFVMRARVPMQLPRDYAHRPQSKVSLEDSEAKIDRNQQQLKSMKLAFKEKMQRQSRGKQHARGINISGSVSSKNH